MADSKHPRKFSEEFKRQMVGLYDNGKPTSEILEEYDLGISTFHRWVTAIHESGSTKAADNRTPEGRGSSSCARRAGSSRWRTIF